MCLPIFKRSLAFSALALVFLTCNTSNAGVLLSYTASPNTIFQGGSGSIDVTLKNLDLVNSSQDIFSFDFTLEATPSSGITFTSLDFPGANYIYGGPGNNSYNLDPINSLPLQVGGPGSSISAQDLWNQLAGTGRFLAAGETVSLATIQFSVAANAAPGIHALTFTTADLLRFDPFVFDFAPVDNVSIVTPDITVVQNVNAVPEPASVLVFLSLAGAVVLKRRRTQKV